MPNFTKISIVTPSFNQSDYLEQTINSVLSQNYPNLEYIVIDGGSTDNSAEIIKKYEKDLKYWVSEKDDGHGHALNKGFTQSTGEIMAWLNSDDKYTAWSFQVVQEIFDKFPHVNWIVGYNGFWNNKGYMTGANRIPVNIYNYLLGSNFWIQQESTFWRRSLWEKAGGFISTDNEFMVDGELWSRFFLHDDLYTVDCILGGYRFHSKNRANLNIKACHNEMMKIVSKMKDNSSDEVIDCFNQYVMLSKIEKFPFGYRLLNSKLGKKHIFPDRFEKMAYKNIYYKDEEWVERRLPFNC
ncbi:MAG: glycosyltransferase [Melioribacteraceae bacterium]|nr:glycosyltransferase [Melioribacteraceae bacterium]MCF8263076.1 glycosyltransferase [Melioribacteraceae bacterium]MCF8431224.1 glycosyltransferase [Melioribacteraceae bacterium]